MVISRRPLRRSGLRLAIQQHSPQPLLEQHPPSCACDIPLTAPDREHRLSATMRPLSSSTASSARLEPVEGPACRNGFVNLRPPHPFLARDRPQSRHGVLLLPASRPAGRPPVVSHRHTAHRLRPTGRRLPQWNVARREPRFTISTDFSITSLRTGRRR